VAVADVTGVSKLALTGDVVWTAPIAGALDLATDAAGNIYGRTAATLFAVSSAGAVKWIHPVDTVDTVEDSPQSFESAVAASPDGSVIAVLTDDGAVVVDGDGAPRFTVLGQFAEGLAVGPDGTVAITVPSAVFIEQDDVLRYTADGMPLATLGPLPGNADPSIAFDPQGFVCANTTGHSEITLSRMAPDGTVVFEQTAFVRSGAGIAAGVLASSASEVIGVHAVNNSEIVTGLQIDVLAPDGTPTWSHTKVGGEVFIGLLADAPTPTGVASSGKRFAVAGTYGGNFPWIQIYELP
jgi:hypothetical protein